MLALSAIKSWNGYPVDVSGIISLPDVLDAIHQVKQVTYIDKAKIIVPSPGIDEVTERVAQRLAKYADIQ